jgi:hypothetical protein
VGVRCLPAAPAVLLALLAAGGCGSVSTAKRTCEGSVALCSRRLDQVYFAGTHNSFAISSQPGWHFASQNEPISRQLEDGIRALLIDVHYGVRDPAGGRVRTDFRAEGADANKVAEQVPAEALRVADHVAGGIGLGSLKGTPELYLCHTLCELGADPLKRELEVIRQFLERHRGAVLIVIVEDYIPAKSIESAFGAAGLTRYTATLAKGSPLPTLGELVSSDKRLLVFSEKRGGAPSWYMPAFTFIQDTPLGALHPGQLSCARARGKADSPLLLINHWIPPFPPSAAVNAQIGRGLFLRGRIAACTRARKRSAAITAVDFYQRTAVVAVTRALNGLG